MRLLLDEDVPKKLAPVPASARSPHRHHYRVAQCQERPLLKLIEEETFGAFVTADQAMENELTRGAAALERDLAWAAIRRDRMLLRKT